MPNNAGNLLDLDGNYNVTDGKMWTDVCIADSSNDSSNPAAAAQTEITGMPQSTNTATKNPNRPLPNAHWYSFDAGLVKFITINTEFYMDYCDRVHQNCPSLRKTQFKWLIQELEKANRKEERAQRPWVIVWSHHPLYCSGEGSDCGFEGTNVRTGVRGENLMLCA